MLEKAQALVKMNMPMSFIRENPIFDHIIAMKYETSNDDETCFEHYRQEIDEFYEHFIEVNA